MRINKINKKGQVGLDTSKAVMYSLMTLTIIAVALIILISTLKNSNVASNTGTLSQVDTVTAVAHAARPLSQQGLEDCTATVIEARNATSLTLIPATNYTVSACTILYNTGQGNANGFNNSNWQVNYTATFNSYSLISNNVTGGISGFFANTTIWFALLGVVIIILIIAVVIFAVNSFGARNQGAI